MIKKLIVPMMVGLLIIGGVATYCSIEGFQSLSDGTVTQSPLVTPMPPGGGDQPPGGLSGGGELPGGQLGGGQHGQRPDLAAVAEELGVTEQALLEALGDPSDGPPDLAAAAQALGVTEEDLQQALGPPQGGSPGGGDQPPSGSPGGEGPSGGGPPSGGPPGGDWGRPDGP
jgi:hypothetical protein